MCLLIIEPSGNNRIQDGIQGIVSLRDGEISCWHFKHLKILAKEL